MNAIRKDWKERKRGKNNMTYQEWKNLKSVRGADTKRIVRNFELNNPHLAAMYEQQQAEETEKMRQAMTVDDRMERWKTIAKLEDSGYADWKARREREVM